MNNYKKSTILGYFRLIIHYISSFLLVPIMLATLGDGDYGVYKIMTAISSYFIIADGGLSNTSIKFLAETRAKGDAESRKKYCFIALGYYTVISFVLGFVGIVLYIFIPKIYGNSLDYDELKIAQEMVLPLILNYCLKLYTSLFRGYIKAFERYDVSKVGEIIQDLLHFFIILIYLKNNGSVVGCLYVDLVISIIVLAFYILYSTIMLSFSFTINGDRVLYKSVFSFSGAILLDTIAFQIFWTVDSVILGVMESATTVTIYSIATTINGYYQSISSVSNEFLMPEIIKKEAYDNSAHLNKMVLYSRLKLTLLGLILVGILIVGKQFIYLWVGEQYESSYNILLILMIPQLFIQILDYQANLMWIRGKHKVRANIMICVAIVNVFLTVIGIRLYGMLGAAVATAISLVLGQGIISAIYYAHVLKIDMISFYIKSFSKIWIGMFTTLLIGEMISKSIQMWMKSVSWISFIIQVGFITLLYLGIVLGICLNKEEKKWLIFFRREK